MQRNRKTDLNVAIQSLERSKHRRVTSVTFAIKEQALPNGHTKAKKVLIKNLGQIAPATTPQADSRFKPEQVYEYLDGGLSATWRLLLRRIVSLARPRIPS
jgi:hypothetical protein